jgi:hypothetical protein
MGRAHLLLDQLQLLCLEQLLRDALGARLGAEKELPQLLAERRRVFVEKPGKLNLKTFDIGLHGYCCQ